MRSPAPPLMSGDSLLTAATTCSTRAALAKGPRCSAGRRFAHPSIARRTPLVGRRLPRRRHVPGGVAGGPGRRRERRRRQGSRERGRRGHRKHGRQRQSQREHQSEKQATAPPAEEGPQHEGGGAGGFGPPEGPWTENIEKNPAVRRRPQWQGRAPASTPRRPRAQKMGTCTAPASNRAKAARRSSPRRRNDGLETDKGCPSL